MKAYKGFNKDWRCLGSGTPYQFEVGKSYTHDGPVKLCSSGFHACEAPLDVWNHYPPFEGNQFAEVELDGVTDEKEGDTKRAGKSIVIKAALTIAGLVSAQIEWCQKNADSKNISSGNYSKAASSGNFSTAASSGNSSKAASSGNFSTAASSGDYSTAASSGNSSTAASSGNSSKAASSGNSSTAASSGNSSKAASSGNYSTAASSGNYSKAASSGNSSTAASSGNYSTAASSGNYSKAASSGNSSTAASSGNYSTAASSGNYSTAASSGNYSTAASSGNYSTAACDTNGFACVAGIAGRVKGNAGSALSCGYKDKADKNRIAVAYVGEDGIIADTWYRVNDDGEFVKAQ